MLRGLNAYQSNGHALAQRALQAAYPVTAMLLGSDSFAMLARAFWHRHPPQTGDVAEWGATLANFVTADPQLVDLPYLADLTRLEWAVHQAHRCADVAAAPLSFALLTGTPAHALRPLWAPGLTLLASPWPVVSLWQAHQHGAPDAKVTRRLQAELVRARPQTAVVWRVGWRVKVVALDADTATLLQSLHGAPTLGQAADAWRARTKPRPAVDDDRLHPRLAQALAPLVRDQILLGLRVDPAQ